MRAVVVGGGIAGLAAARRLEALVPDVEVVLLESDGLVGGKIRTERVHGFVIEAAPDSFLSRKERGVGLCEELDLGGELIGRRPEHARTFVRRAGDLHPLPEGLTGMIPTNLDGLERSGILSPEGKARFRAERDVPVAPGDGDESVASFVSRRFGREAYESLVEPLMTGIYGGDGEQMSLRATVPQLRVLELEHGSLLRGLPVQPPQGERPPFVSLRGGMDTFVTRLVERLERTRIVTGVAATRLATTSPGYEVETEDGESLDCEAVVLATPAFVTAELLLDLDHELAAAHAEIPYASSVVVTLAFSRADVLPLDGYGYLVPHTQGSDVLACTWSSQKWSGRAPDESVLLRVYAGRFGRRDLTRENDETLVALARDELRHLDIEAEPTLARVHRWAQGMPQYILGHPERLERIETAVGTHPGLALAGAAYHGVGIPDCIRSGELAAEAVARALSGAGA
ncbi:MAG TPA: protoporphyrinogen oxidase [Gaiellaceae bacterium]|nr:protoporphyrinogen oxidase [Gaiellaceae bacterium]